MRTDLLVSNLLNQFAAQYGLVDVCGVQYATECQRTC